MTVRIFLSAATYQRFSFRQVLGKFVERTMRRNTGFPTNAMKVGIRIASALLGLVLTSAASAGQTVARIERLLIVEGNNLVYIYPVGGVVNSPGCHGANGNYYSFSMSRARAKEYLAGMLSAQAQGATVTFYGTGTCVDQPYSETLSYFAISS